MIYEFRTYTCMPGKLPAVMKRFETATIALFKKHKFRNSPIMTTAIGPSSAEIKYFLQWESMAERDASWAAFRADPTWQQALADSERDGPIVEKLTNEILQPAAFSV